MMPRPSYILNDGEKIPASLQLREVTVMYLIASLGSQASLQLYCAKMEGRGLRDLIRYSDTG